MNNNRYQLKQLSRGHNYGEIGLNWIQPLGAAFSSDYSLEGDPTCQN